MGLVSWWKDRKKPNIVLSPEDQAEADRMGIPMAEILQTAVKTGKPVMWTRDGGIKTYDND